eukprot:gene16193-17821_t
MPFRTFRNAFRNLIQLENLRGAQRNARFTYRTSKAGVSVSSHGVFARCIGKARRSARPPLSSWASWGNTAHQTVSKLFALRVNSGFSALYGSAIQYIQSFRRLSALPMFGAFAYYQGCASESDRAPYKPPITELFEAVKQNLFSTEKVASTFPADFKPSRNLDDYELTERLGNPSSSAAIYSAVHKGQQLAMKIMFNFEFASNSYALQKGFHKECKVVTQDNRGIQEDLESLPAHPNIIQILDAFDQETPCPADALNSYPHALPPRLSRDGFGRNKTLCLVMPKYDCTLKEYVNTRHSSKERLGEHEAMLLLAQLLEGVAHLVDNNEAHRDLKSDNVLLRLSNCDVGIGNCPQLVIADFGCCLADARLGMKLPFESLYVDRGGNSALMAPEIASMKPGRGKFLDYTKSDVWACGALAYEIFGCVNPFTTGFLDSRFYEDSQLPELPSVQPFVTKLVHLLLRKDPSQRPMATEAVTMVMLMLYAPNSWLLSGNFDLIKEADVDAWLLTLCLTTCGEERRFSNQDLPLPADLTLRKCFLRRSSCPLVLSALAYLHDR